MVTAARENNHNGRRSPNETKPVVWSLPSGRRVLWPCRENRKSSNVDASQRVVKTGRGVFPDSAFLAAGRNEPRLRLLNNSRAAIVTWATFAYENTFTLIRFKSFIVYIIVLISSRIGRQVRIVLKRHYKICVKI